MNYEGFVIDYGGSSPLDLGAGGTLRLAALTIPPAKKLPVWVTGGESDGSRLVRAPFYANRECTMQVRVATTSMDLAMSAVGLLEGKLQEAEKIAGGMPVLWTPADSTQSLTLKMLFGEIIDIPVTVADGWFTHQPIINVNFSCKPFLYGTEVNGPSVSGTDPILTVTVPGVPGDIPAEARVVLTDTATQSRRWVEWGLEQQHYNAGSPAAALIDSEDLAVTGFSGALATRTGGYRRAGATHDTVSATLLASSVAVCGTGTQPHIGTFRVKARVWAASVNQYWRLAWQQGDGGWTENAYVQPRAAGAFNELDLGVITVEQAQAGTQKWSGRIEAYTTTGATELGEVDYLILFPVAEGWGRLEATPSGLVGVTSGYDDFFTASSTLNARTAVLGGAWATSGATTDFTADSHSLGAVGGFVESRTTAVNESGGPRFAILGSTTYTDVAASVMVHFNPSGAGPGKYALLIARYVDASNYALLEIQNQTATICQFRIAVVVATVRTDLLLRQFAPPPLTYWTLSLAISAAGQAAASVATTSGTTLASGVATSAALATGGALASGKAGFGDRSGDTQAIARYYTNFSVGAAPAEAFIINSGRSLEIRSDSNLRQSPDGATYGDIPSRGSRLFIPQAGDAGRTTRIVARATRNDLITAADTPLADSLGLAVHYTPRYLAVPRA